VRRKSILALQLQHVSPNQKSRRSAMSIFFASNTRRRTDRAELELEALMDLITSMATFVRVVDAGGFASAGRALGMSPSTVTEHVHALEARLGVRLLNRSTRKISHTEVGGTYYERSKQILADIDEADRIAHALHSSPRGTLHLNTSVAIPPFLAPVIAEYGDLNPDVSVNLSMTECMVDMVGEGFDLAVRDTPVADLNLIARRVATYRFVVCGAPSYLKRRGTPKRPTDLHEHNCLGCFPLRLGR
jgi:DNA-binding transcriptional LysR family regulator